MVWSGYDTFDWSGCDEVERVEGKKGGVPILKHTRMQADLVVDNYQAGLSADEIAEVYLLDPRQVKAVISMHSSYSFARRSGSRDPELGCPPRLAWGSSGHQRSRAFE